MFWSCAVCIILDWQKDIKREGRRDGRVGGGGGEVAEGERDESMYDLFDGIDIILFWLKFLNNPNPGNKP